MGRWNGSAKFQLTEGWVVELNLVPSFCRSIPADLPFLPTSVTKRKKYASSLSLTPISP